MRTPATGENARNALPRVVAVGFNKCATRSLARLFEAAGHRVVHHKLRDRWPVPRKIGRVMQENLAAGRPVFHSAEGYTFYCDLILSTPEGTWDGNSAFREILRDYPDTILLLNLRDREHWIASRLKHGHGEFATREQKARGLGSTEALTAAWRAEWDAHVTALRAFMADRPEQFIEFNIDTDTPEMLVERLPDYGLDPKDFHDIGRTRGRHEGPLVRAVKTFVSKARPRLSR